MWNAFFVCFTMSGSLCVIVLQVQALGSMPAPWTTFVKNVVLLELRPSGRCLCFFTFSATTYHLVDDVYVVSPHFPTPDLYIGLGLVWVARETTKDSSLASATVIVHSQLTWLYRGSVDTMPWARLRLKTFLIIKLRYRLIDKLFRLVIENSKLVSLRLKDLLIFHPLVIIEFSNKIL